jgi:hypothetical protein
LVGGAFLFFLLDTFNNEIGAIKDIMNIVRFRKVQQGGMWPENPKNITTDKNIWARSITGIIVDSSAVSNFRI